MSARSRRAAPGEPFVCQQRGEVSLHFGMASVQSRMRITDPNRLVLDYTRAMMSFLLLQPAPRHIVMLGLGGGSLVKYCHAHLPETRFTALEINPEVVRMRGLFAIPPDDERLQVVCVDGAQWLREHPQSCDVLLLDGFDVDGLPPALYSQEFFDVCAAALQPGGVLTSNIWAPLAVRDTVIARLRASFDSGVATMDAEQGENTIALAGHWHDWPTGDTLHRRARELDAAHPLDLPSAARRLERSLQGAGREALPD